MSSECTTQLLILRWTVPLKAKAVICETPELTRETYTCPCASACLWTGRRLRWPPWKLQSTALLHTDTAALPHCTLPLIDCATVYSARAHTTQLSQWMQRHTHTRAHAQKHNKIQCANSLAEEAWWVISTCGTLHARWMIGLWFLWFILQAI